MKKLVRFGVSLDHHLLDDFDDVVRRRKYATRSEALRDLIRDQLVSQEWSSDTNREAVATITFVYDHHCLEVLVVKGKGSEIREVADALVSVKGVKHGKLTMTTTGKGIV